MTQQRMMTLDEIFAREQKRLKEQAAERAERERNDPEYQAEQKARSDALASELQAAQDTDDSQQYHS